MSNSDALFCSDCDPLLALHKLQSMNISKMHEQYLQILTLPSLNG